MRINKNGQRNQQDWSAQHFTYIPTPPAKHMAETCEALLVRLTGIVGQKFAKAYPDCPLLPEAIAALERLQKFSEEKGTPTHDPNN
jgi:hypothetical protein